MSQEIKKHKGTFATYYMAPCFGYRRQRGMYYASFGSVGLIGDQIHPWNASSPLAKKEYDRAYKFWGRRVMSNQLARGDNRDE